jgi:hypothetical protein
MRRGRTGLPALTGARPRGTLPPAASAITVLRDETGRIFTLFNRIGIGPE